jgi:hydroxymethylbilane synthase
MPKPHRPIVIATRGSALALAQARAVMAQCRQVAPELEFELKIMKTTGDLRLGVSLAQPDPSLPKGLFTKELETALLEGAADLAVHSLKDLPTELPPGLVLGAVSSRADVRDVLVYRTLAGEGQGKLRGFGPGLRLEDLPEAAVVATSSTRRRAQLLEINPGLRTVEIRGNVATRLRKLATGPDLDGTLLAAAGLQRLGFVVTANGALAGAAVPGGLRASMLPLEAMLPCVGQAALGMEVREHDSRLAELCLRLNHPETMACVTAERAFLRAMGGGCQSPVAAYADWVGHDLRLRAVSFRDGAARRAEASGPREEAVQLGGQIADRLR